MCRARRFHGEFGRMSDGRETRAPFDTNRVGSCFFKVLGDSGYAHATSRFAERHLKECLLGKLVSRKHTST